MQSPSSIPTADIVPIQPVDHSIMGIFAGTGFSLFGFLMLIMLLA